MGNGPAHRDESHRDRVVQAVLDRYPELDPSTHWDTLIGALSKRRRRYLLYLVAEDPRVSIEDLAARILALEGEVHGSPIDEGTQEDVLISLVHRDVPVMVDAGLVTYDEHGESVGRGDRFSDALDLLEGAFRRSSEQET